MNNKGRKIAYIGVFSALAMVFGYLEMLIPVNLGIPGAKLGIANVVTVTVLFTLRKRDALYITLIRIILNGILFGSLLSMIYSLAGGLTSLTVMTVLSKLKCFSMIGVSVVGGVSHNLAQLIVATFIIKNLSIMYYLPFLIVAGVITGIVIGILSKLISERLNFMFCP